MFKITWLFIIFNKFHDFSRPGKQKPFSMTFPGCGKPALRPPTLSWEWSKDFPSDSKLLTFDYAHWHNVYVWWHSHQLRCTRMDIYVHQSCVKIHLLLVYRATTIHAIHVAPGNQCRLAARTGIIRGRSLYLVCGKNIHALNPPQISQFQHQEGNNEMKLPES